MPCPQPAPVALPRWARPTVEVADVFRAQGKAYRQRHALTPDQLTVMRAIEACRTSVLGGHVDVCASCGDARPSYNSCRNRHCPKCQGLAQSAWIARRMERVLPVPYFHVVFTVPAELRALCRHNAEALYDLLFETVSKTLLELGHDVDRLGAQIGFTAVLHTWTRTLAFHPHLHCIVTGGGLSPDGDRWIHARRKYLFPVKVLGRLFRGKFLARLRQLYERGQLVLDGSLAALRTPASFRRLLDALYRTDWVVYAKRPFGGPEQIYNYLGRYTHRVGLSNQRLVSFDGQAVCFRTKNGQTLTLSAEEFIRRFLQHVLPAGFCKIRHYGLMAPAHAKTRLALARRLLQPENTAATAAPPEPDAVLAGTGDWRDELRNLTGVDLKVCARCGGDMVRQPLSSSIGADTS